MLRENETLIGKLFIIGAILVKKMNLHVLFGSLENGRRDWTFISLVNAAC
jgi:hypothetical protein